MFLRSELIVQRRVRRNAERRETLVKTFGSRVVHKNLPTLPEHSFQYYISYYWLLLSGNTCGHSIRQFDFMSEKWGDFVYFNCIVIFAKKSKYSFLIGRKTENVSKLSQKVQNKSSSGRNFYQQTSDSYSTTQKAMGEEIKTSLWAPSLERISLISYFFLLLFLYVYFSKPSSFHWKYSVICEYGTPTVGSGPKSYCPAPNRARLYWANTLCQNALSTDLYRIFTYWDIRFEFNFHFNS